MTDLDQNGSQFICQALIWTASNLKSGLTYSTCGTSVYILGGYNILGTSLVGASNGDYYQRVYSHLPTHNLIQYSFSLYALDNWSSNILTQSLLKVSFDGTVMTSVALDNSAFSTNTCGASNNDLTTVKIYGIMKHSAISLTLQILHYLNQDSSLASIGIRDLNMNFATVSTGIYTNLICGYASGVTFYSGKCVCPVGQYNTTTSGGCTTCDSSCASCYGAGSNQCYTCATGYSFNGQQCIKCDSACSVCYGTNYDACTICNLGYWLLNGTTCIPSCDYPLIQNVTGTQITCNSPCSTGQYLYWDGTCSSSCASPLQTNTLWSTIPTCNWNCSSITENLYWNGTCSSTCSFPLTTVISHSRRFCTDTCSQYLYWNGSCISTCSSPLSTRTEGGKNFCDYPCAAYQYLYWNGSCLNSCLSPYSSRFEGGYQFCDYPCATTGEYLYWNSSCLSTCSSPLRTRTEASRQYCDYSCEVTQYLYWDGTCSNDCDFPLTIRTEASRQYCDYGCTTGQYLYWNGSCKSTCSYPLTNYTISGNLYCDYPCYLDQYLYWNGSCINNCSSPLSARTEANRLYCDYPCTASQYLYWNGSCLGTCSSPLSTRTEASRQYCDYLCDVTQYLYWNGTCSNDCDSPLTVRTEASQQYCDYLCTGSQFLYWNGSCLSTCTSPLSQRTDSAGQKYCDYLCETTQYLYWNGSCINTCASPLTPRTEANRQYCDYSCTASQYLYWNGTCASTCSFPLTTRTEGSKKICDYSCCSFEYLYWNGTCANTCSSPLTARTEAGQQYCDFPCITSTNFLYWNRTCSSSCPSPLVSSTLGTVQSRKFCNSPCGSYDYLYSNGSCLSTCPDHYYSLSVGGVKYCYSPCLSTEYLVWDGSCITSCPSPMKKVTYDYGKVCEGPCNNVLEYYHTDTLVCDTTCSSATSIILGLYLTCSPNGTVVTPPVPNTTVVVNNIRENNVLILGKTKLVGMLKYLYFLDITYPPSLELISVSKGRNILSPRLVLFETSSASSSKLPEVKLPGVFDSRDVKSNFFVNFWDEFMLILIILVIAILFWIGQKTAEKRSFEKIRRVCARMNILLKWNIFFVIFATNMDNIILYAGLQFMSLDVSSGLEVFSLGLCFILLGLIVAFFAGTVYFIKKRRVNKVTPLAVAKVTSSTSTEADESQTTEYPSLQVLYRGFKEDRFGSYFYPIYTFRSILPLMLTLFLYQSPLIQIVLQIPIGLVMIALVVVKKPIQSKLSHIELIIQETIVLVVNCAAIGIVVLSNQDKSDSTMADFLGEIIIRGSQAINWTVVVFLAIRVTLEAQEIQRLRATKYANDKTVWIHLLCHFVQQGGFGFEKLTILNLPSYKDSSKSASAISVPKLFNNNEEDRTLSTTNPLSGTIPTHAPTTKTVQEDDEAETPRIFGVDSETLAGSENRAVPRWRKATRDKNCASFLLRPDRPSYIASDANSSILKSLPTRGRDSTMQNFANDSFAETPESPTRARSHTAETDENTIKLQNVEQTSPSRLFSPLEPTSASRLFTPIESTRNLLFSEPENNYKGRIHRKSNFGGDFGTRNNFQNEDDQSGDQTTRSLRNEINMKFEISESPIFKRTRLSIKPDEPKFGSWSFEGLDVTNKSLNVIEENGTPKLQKQFDTPKSETPITTGFSMRDA